jgi:hypothetical protein
MKALNMSVSFVHLTLDLKMVSVSQMSVQMANFFSRTVPVTSVLSDKDLIKMGIANHA